MKADETADRSSLSEQALARSERLLREMAQSMGEGLMVADREGRLLLMNPSAERLLGSPRALQSIEQWPAQFGIFRADRTTPMPPAELAMARALRGESHDRAECFVRNESVPEGRWVLASGRPLRDQAGEIAGAVVMLQDVTEQRLLEQRLLHAQKMEAIGTLAGGIAHDFNSVLYAVLGYAELALEL